MSVVLELLEDVRWRGQPVTGDRSRALLAALAYDQGRTVQPSRLIELVWGDEEPSNGVKGLQVLVSRTRTACGADAIVSDAGGYRLGVPATDVDSIWLSTLVRDAGKALQRDSVRAVDLARSALALGEGMSPTSNGHNGDSNALTQIREDAATQLETATIILAQALSRTGQHTEGLAALARAWAEHEDDESILADLLKSEAVVRGPGSALERYESYRRDLRDRLGASPGEPLQALHRELLALDQPIRTGVRYGPTALLGRDHDLERLRALTHSSRVVSIVGPGGLGKTRLAHVLARDPSLPVAHVVELVGVTSPDDVVAEVAVALGVRDSVSSRRTLTSAQRADLRARTAQRLAQAPSLLVLDNCEHLIVAVAELVAFLVSTTPELRVITTSRAPLAIAAEHVYLLGELGRDAAAALFRTRAEAARSQVQLDHDAVESIVTRLDGLPLAIELAAAKVRVMSVEEIDRRLENRFALLRGGDRSAPDRHQTLLAVIDWSWNLLNDSERRALRWLALFHDGFTLEAAGQVLGSDALDAVQGLVSQSLLKVEEGPTGIRYRMLETVREFGRMQLIDAGEDAEAHSALRDWAVQFAEIHRHRLSGVDQFAAIDALGPEQANLGDEMRTAIENDDTETLVSLLATLGTFWSVRGDHGRLMVLGEAIGKAVCDWVPPPRLENAARASMAVMMSNTLITTAAFMEPMHSLLERLGPGDGTDPRFAGFVRVMLAWDPHEVGAFEQKLDDLAQDSDRYTARTANQWLSHVRENSGDTDGAISAGEAALALIDDGDGPWNKAILRYQLAQLLAQQGKPDLAVEHANAALVVMRRIGATDDQLQLHALLALCALDDDRLADAERELEELAQLDPDATAFGGLAFRQVGRAELELARGHYREGLSTYRDCAEYMRGLRFPGIETSGIEPWALFGDAAALTAHAHFAGPEDEAAGRTLFESCRDRTARALASGEVFIDCPVLGMQLFALGAWGLMHDAIPVPDALRLLALAKHFSYVRMSPSSSWKRMAALADERSPGTLASVAEEYEGRRPTDLFDHVRATVEQIGS